MTQITRNEILIRRIFPYLEIRDYRSFALVNRQFYSVVNDIAANFIGDLEMRFPPISQREISLYPLLSDNTRWKDVSKRRFSFLALLGAIFSNIEDKISYIPGGRKFLEELENENLPLTEYVNNKRKYSFPIVFMRLERMLEWKRDKDFINFLKLLRITGFESFPALDALLRNITKMNLSDGANIAREWMTEKENQKDLSLVKRFKLEGLGLTELPSEIGQLTTLKNLSLCQNHLMFLPFEIRQLTNLQVLDLSNNQFVSLPQEIYWLISLKKLDLCNNRLISLSSMFSLLTNLQYINLSSNRLTLLPPQVGQLTKLQELNLDDNQLKKLPGEICQLKSLQFLSLERNQIWTLPSKIDQLTALQCLRLLGNTNLSLTPSIIRLFHLGVSVYIEMRS